MKLIITIASADRNIFDYKIMFFLSREFQLFSTSSGGNEYGFTLFATMAKEIDNSTEIETLRRNLSKEMHKSIENELANSSRYDINEHKIFDEDKLDKCRQEFDSRILIFLLTNQKFLQIVKEHKRKDYGRLVNFMQLRDQKDLFIDSEKSDEFDKLYLEATEILEYANNFVLGPASF